MPNLFGCLGFRSKKKIKPKVQSLDSLNRINPGIAPSAALARLGRNGQDANNFRVRYYRVRMLNAVKQNGMALRRASTELRADHEVVKAAVKQNGLALRHASKELRADSDVVKAAVKQSGMALCHASEELRANKEVVLDAVAQQPQSIEFASDALKQNKNFILKCIKTRPVDWHAILSLANVNKHIGTIDENGYLLIKNRTFLIDLIKIQPDVYLLTHPELKADSDIMLAAIKKVLFLQGISTWETLEPKSDPSKILSTCGGTLNGKLLSGNEFKFNLNPASIPKEKLKKIATQLNNSIDTYKTFPLSPEQIQIKEFQGQFYIFIRSKEDVLRQLLPLLSEGPLKLEFGKVLKDNPLLGA
jgi:hypothetical protein